MPRYNYQCNNCRRKAEKVKGSELVGDELYEVIFETKHPMEPTPKELAEARVCPRCNSRDTEKTLFGVDVQCYVRGNGYLDRVGCHRDMDLQKLVTDDPYAGMRQPGEVDELANRLRKHGQPKPKIFTK